MMENFCAFISKASLALLLLNAVMLAFVRPGSAEQVITLLSMMAVLFAVSSAKLHRQCAKGESENGQKKSSKENKT